MRGLRQPLRIILTGTILLPIVLGLVAVAARFSDGPIVVFPGGPLVAGVVTDFEAVDWGRVAHLREMEFQLETPPRSRTVWFSINEGALYIPCAFCANRYLKRWPRELEQDNRVVLRIRGMLIKARAERVPNGSAEYRAARTNHELKYSTTSSSRSAAEGRASDVVVGVARLAPGAGDTQDSDSWMYRIGPR